MEEKGRPPEIDDGCGYSIEEVKASFVSQGFGVHMAEAEAMHDYWASAGWKRGKGRPIEDLNAAVRSWMRNRARFDAKGPPEKRADETKVDYSGIEDADEFFERMGLYGGEKTDGDTAA